MTYSALNLETFNMDNLNEAFQIMYESFEKFVRESS